MNDTNDKSPCSDAGAFCLYLKMNELTYILGAGASYQSIPVVKTFSSRFKEFVSHIENLRFQYPHIYTSACNAVKIFSNQINSHQSFDTYFKKLFHTKEIELIAISKRILNLYFIWEHLKEDYETERRKENQFSERREFTEYDFEKKSKIDKRYDALVAGLLKPIKGKTEVFCKTNFITWNYDLNLFLSLKNYFSPESTIGQFKDSIQKSSFEWNIYDQISVINMNGYFYSNEFDGIENLNRDLSFEHILMKKNNNGFFETEIVNKDAELIKFAWESELHQAKIAKEKIQASKNIVAIGYTFPLYNRLIDFSYLETNDLGYDKRMIIQDPNADKIRQNLLDLFELIEDGTLKQNLIAKTDCESFYVPANIYDNKKFQAYSFADDE